ncbi:MAG: hypothetical protein LBP40_05545 [Campylobacteraceae bacterium]|jgi:hypothetical protein|nr:hypothetical protein [Campylobacteraceae bacterium]
MRYNDEQEFIQAYNQKFNTNLDAATVKNWTDPKIETRITVGEVKNLTELFEPPKSRSIIKPKGSKNLTELFDVIISEFSNKTKDIGLILKDMER